MSDYLPVPRPVTAEEEHEYRQREEARRQQREFDDELGLDLEVESVQRMIFEARSAGATFASIAEQFRQYGIGSPAAAWRAHRAYVRQHRSAASDVDAFVSKQLAECDMVRQRVIREALAQDPDARPFTFAAPALLKIQERESWLVGMNPGHIADELAALSDDELNAG